MNFQKAAEKLEIPLQGKSDFKVCNQNNSLCLEKQLESASTKDESTYKRSQKKNDYREPYINNKRYSGFNHSQSNSQNDSQNNSKKNSNQRCSENVNLNNSSNIKNNHTHIHNHSHNNNNSQSNSNNSSNTLNQNSDDNIDPVYLMNMMNQSTPDNYKKECDEIQKNEKNNGILGKKRKEENTSSDNKNSDESRNNIHSSNKSRNSKKISSKNTGMFNNLNKKIQLDDNKINNLKFNLMKTNSDKETGQNNISINSEDDFEKMCVRTLTLNKINQILQSSSTPEKINLYNLVSNWGAPKKSKNKNTEILDCFLNNFNFKAVNEKIFQNMLGYKVQRDVLKFTVEKFCKYLKSSGYVITKNGRGKNTEEGGGTFPDDTKNFAEDVEMVDRSDENNGKSSEPENYYNTEKKQKNKK